MAVWIWFIILFAASWIPWFIAVDANIKPHSASEEDKHILRGLSLIDTVLTAASMVFLFLWLWWWALLFYGLLVGVAFIFEGFNLNPYRAIKSQ